MIFRYLVAAACVLASTFSFAQANSIAYSFPDALSKAQLEGKDILVTFSEAWCGPCQRMKKTLFVQADIVGQIASNYVFVKAGVDIPTEWNQRYNVTTLPHTLILDAYGNMKARLEGGATTTEFSQFLSCQCSIQKSFVSPDGEDSFVTFASLMNKSEDLQQERYWSVQAGKYHGSRWAVVQKENLESQYQDVHMTYDQNNEGKHVYRVFVGRYADAKTAIHARDKMRAAGVKCHVKHL